MQQESPVRPTYHQDDEIDLFELFENIWSQKWLVAMVTAVALIAGGAFAFLSTPTYEAKVQLLPPSNKDIIELKNSATPVGSKQFSAEDIYADFVTNLQSNQAKQLFLSQEDVRAYFAKLASTPESRWKAFNKALTIDLPKKGPVVQVGIAFHLADADIAADFANRYVSLVIQMTRLQLADDFRAEIDSAIEALELQIQNHKSLYVSQIDTELEKLKEALEIANKIGLEEPLKTDSILDNDSTMMVDEIRRLYRLGSRALEAEIQVIRERRENIALTPGIMQLEQKLSLLRSMDVDEEKIFPAKTDLMAMPPEKPIKPKKALILALSVVLGGMLGVMIALIRSAIRNRQAKAAAGKEI